MSERGSFVTEYIYCEKCFEAAKAVLTSREKYLCTATLPSWLDDEKELPIIAGKVGGLYPGEEIHIFAFKFVEELELRICHPLRIAVLAESGEKIFTVKPSKDPE